MQHTMLPATHLLSLLDFSTCTVDSSMHLVSIPYQVDLSYLRDQPCRGAARKGTLPPWWQHSVVSLFYVETNLGSVFKSFLRKSIERLTPFPSVVISSLAYLFLGFLFRSSQFCLSLTSASRCRLANKPLALNSLSQSLLLENPKSMTPWQA